MNFLEFANPLGWWWAALALPIIGFYILKVRLRRQAVSTLLFWDRVFEEKKPRAWWQQLRHWLSLLLQLALLMLLVGALMDPLWSWQKNQRRKIVLVIDNSASMGAMEDGTLRLVSAKATGSALVRSLRFGDEMAVLTAGGRATVAIGLTGHVRSLLEAIQRIELTDAPSSLVAAVSMAKHLVPSSNQAKIMLLTDGCDMAMAELQQDRELLSYGFGSPQDNLAITRFQVRRSLLDAIGYQVLVEVSNLGDQPRKCRLNLTLEDALVDVLPIDLDAGASTTFNLDHASATGGRLVAQLDAADGLAVDNRALAILPTRQKMPITLVTSGSVFLKSVFESIPLVDLSIVESLDENWSSASHRILVLHQNMPGQLPAGKVLVINPRSDCDLWTVGEPIETPLVSTLDESSPVTQHVRLTNVLFPDARRLTYSGESEALIKTPLDEPLLSHIRRPTGDVLVLNVNLDLGDLPLRIAFPVLMKNAVEWFQGTQGELRPALATGQPASITLPRLAQNAETFTSPSATSDSAASVALEVVKADANQLVTQEFVLRSPTGEVSPLARDETSATLTMLNRCGLWTIGTLAALRRDPWRQVASATPARLNSLPGALPGALPGRSPVTANGMENLAVDDPQLVRVACNLCNREESDLRPRSKLNVPSEFGIRGLGGRSIWYYLVWLSLVVVVVEWWLYQRRVVG